VTVRQPELVWSSPFCISGAAVFRDLDKAQGNGLVDGRLDGMTVYPVALEIIVAARQLAIVAPAMMRVLDFEAIEYPTRAQSENLIGGTFQHGDCACTKLSGD
jgi:hypothetical protein